MVSVTNFLKATKLPAQQKFWKAVWGKRDALKGKLQDSGGEEFDYLDFGEHFGAVKQFCEVVPPKLHILEEYATAFNTFSNNTDGYYAKGACIIGQPGIGKTCFIVYAVVERLRNKLPVAVDVTGWDKPTERYLLFSADGVALHHGYDNTPLRSHPGTWALSDSNAIIQIPMRTFMFNSGGRVFQVTSPKKSRYKEWTKQAVVQRYYINLPSEKDIECLSLVLGKNVTRMNELAARWGPVPRTLIGIHDMPSSECALEDVVYVQVNEDAKDIAHVLDALNDGDSAGADKGTTIFFVKPRYDGPVPDRLMHNVFVPTPWLRDQVVDALLRHEDTQRFERYSVMVGSPGGRPLAGGIFETIVHRFLARGNQVTVRWYTGSAPGPPTSLSFGTSLTWRANVDLRFTSCPFYWVPRSSNFTGIDSAIVTEDCIYAIQVTTAQKREFPKNSLESFRNELPPERKELEIKFLVIGHMKSQTESITPDLIRNLKKAGFGEACVGGITLEVDMVSEKYMGPRKIYQGTRGRARREEAVDTF